MIGFTRSWWLTLLAVVATLVVMVTLPAGSTEQVIFARLVGIVGCGVFLIAVLRLPRSTRAVWLLFWASLALVVGGDILYSFEMDANGAVFPPALSDIPYLASYAFMIAGLALLLKRLLPGRRVETWIDTAIAAIAAGSIMGTYVIGPALQETGASGLELAIAIAYPLADLALLALFIRILFGLRRTNPAMALLALATAFFLVADIWHQFLLIGPNSNNESTIEVLWAAALLTYVLAVTAPGAGRTTTRPPSSDVHVSGVPTVLFAGGVLTTPVLLILATLADAHWITGWLALANVAVVILLLWRARLLVLKVQRQSRELASQAREDALTGLPNRRAWDQDLTQAARLSEKARSPLTVAMLDLDHFKRFNDTLGHQAGDELLAAAATAWRAHLTDGEVLARYGGEEFGLLLPGTDLVGAETVLNHIRLATPSGVTVSIGATELVDGEPVATTMRRADDALYRAKSQGRDQVVLLPRNATEPIIPR